MPHPKNVGRWSLLLFVLACGLTACAARLNEMAAPGSQVEPQVVTPQPVTVQPTDPPLTEVVTIDPADDPFVAALTAYPTFPPTPEPTFYTPNPYDSEGNLKTPTPLPDEVRPTSPPPPTLPIGKIVDLFEGTPGPGFSISVHRADGTYDEYLIPSQQLNDVASGNIDQFLEQLMEVGPGDEILGWIAIQGNGSDATPSIQGNSAEPLQSITTTIAPN